MTTEAVPARISLRFEGVEALEREIEANLGSGRAFVCDPVEVVERQRCLLVLIHPDTEAGLELEAEVVYVKADEPGAGVGLELVAFDEASLARLREFAESQQPKSGKPEAQSKTADLYDRVRHFTTADQLRSAREGDFAERVALERIYGKAVWEVLLHNPRITAPEVIRIARSPKLPKQLIETITGNASWLAVSSLRRSLLMNPQLSGASLDKVLRASPKAELTLISRQSSYPMAVRQAVKKLQGR